MMNRKSFKAAFAVLAIVPLLAAFAGGWATITVENLPEYLVAKQPTNLTFSVRQHGKTLLPNLKPTVVARSGDLEVKASGVATNKVGYYTATVTPPAPGAWTITIHSGFRTSEITLDPITARPATSVSSR
jgi:hypothetical protein